MPYTNKDCDRYRLNCIFAQMKARCNCKTNPRYITYGDRGISVCNEWLGHFDVFYEWAINNGYKKGLHIDRINNDGNYEPSNCQFITNAKNNAVGKQSKQSNNKSGFIGVCYKKNKNTYQSEIMVDGVKTHLGNYKTKVESVLARIDYEINELGSQLTNLAVIHG